MSELLQPHYFTNVDNIRVGMFDMADDDYFIEYRDSTGMCHERELANSEWDSSTQYKNITSYKLTYLPWEVTVTDPSDRAPDDHNYFVGSVVTEMPLFYRGSQLAKVTNSLALRLKQSLYNQAVHDMRCDFTDKSGCIESGSIDFDVRHAQRDEPDSHASITVRMHPIHVRRILVEATIVSDADSSAPLELRRRDAQFSAELLAILIDTLSHIDHFSNKSESERPDVDTTLRVGSPTPREITDFELAFIEAYSLLGYVHADRDMPTLTGHQLFQRLETIGSNSTISALRGISQLAIVDAMQSGTPIGTSSIERAARAEILAREIQC